MARDGSAVVPGSHEILKLLLPGINLGGMDLVALRQVSLSIGAERDPRIGVQKEPLGW